MAKKSQRIRCKRYRENPKYKTRAYNRCNICGRSGAYYRKFGLCRICFRNFAFRGEIPGVMKASW